MEYCSCVGSYFDFPGLEGSLTLYVLTGIASIAVHTSHDSNAM